MLNKRIGVTALIAMALVFWSGASFASFINVGGVKWNPDHPLDFFAQALNLRETSIQNVGDNLAGYGQVAGINGLGESSFCPSCDLNFVFSYTVAAIDGNQVVLDNGTIDFYVAPDDSFNILDPTTAGAGTGTLWLSLVGHQAPYLSFTTTGELYSTITGPTIGNPESGSSGFGLLDVAGGLAGNYFDTNTKDDGADFELNSSFQYLLADGCNAETTYGVDDGCHYPISGQAGLTGATAVPAPRALALMGFGMVLLGLGFLVERRRKYDV